MLTKRQGSSHGTEGNLVGPRMAREGQRESNEAIESLARPEMFKEGWREFEQGRRKFVAARDSWRGPKVGGLGWVLVREMLYLGEKGTQLGFWNFLSFKYELTNQAIRLV